MTAQEKLLLVENSIRKALPRLLELSMGCKLWKDGYFYTYIGKLIPEIDFRYTDPYYLHHFYSEEIVQNKKETFLYAIGNKKFKHYKIIGHDILLSDVLEWLGRVEHKASIHSRAEFVVFVKKGKYTFTRYSACIDFSKPYLKDQSEAFWNFLYNLIKDN